MNLAFLIASLHTGGAQRQLTLLASALRHRGHAVSVHALRPGGLFRHELERAGVTVLAPDRALGARLAVLPRLIRDLRERRPEVVYSFLPTANVLASLLRPALAPARIVWGVRMTSTDLRRYGPFHRLVFALERVRSLRGDLLIANSRAIRDELAPGSGDESRFLVIPNGLEDDRFTFQPEGRERWRRRWEIAPDEIAIGIVGRFDVMKGHEVFFEAARRIAARRPGARFVCVGSGSAARAARLRRLAAASGLEPRIRWQTATSRIAEVYSALDLVCSASIFGEGFPNVLAEAVLCGTPCVGTAVGDASELLAPPDRVVPPGDAEALATACLERLEAGVDRTSDGLRKKLLRTYATHLLLDRTEDALARLVGAPPSPSRQALAVGG